MNYSSQISLKYNSQSSLRHLKNHVEDAKFNSGFVTLRLTRKRILLRVAQSKELFLLFVPLVAVTGILV